jgi:hypothetical protein
MNMSKFLTYHERFLWTGRKLLPQPQSTCPRHGDGARALLHAGKGEKTFTPLDDKNAIGTAIATLTPSIPCLHSLPLLLLSAVSRTSIDSPGHSNFNFVPNQR